MFLVGGNTFLQQRMKVSTNKEYHLKSWCVKRPRGWNGPGRVKWAAPSEYDWNINWVHPWPANKNTSAGWMEAVTCEKRGYSPRSGPPSFILWAANTGVFHTRREPLPPPAKFGLLHHNVAGGLKHILFTGVKVDVQYSFWGSVPRQWVCFR